jgi:hypothetical protein
MDYTGSQVPVFWDAFDSLTNTQFAAQGTLTGSGVTTPDRFVIARWPQIVSTKYDYTITPGASVTSDSAVAVYWSPRAVPPGATLHFATMYGLTSSSAAPPSPPPGPRPIIFIPGITGSFLRDANGNETWPVVQRLADCLTGTHSSAACDLVHLAGNILAPDGSTIPGNPALDVDAANGLQRPLDGAMGGAIDSTHAVHDFVHVDGNIYDVTAQNLKNSGYAEVEPTDDAGLANCATTRMCFIPVGVDWRKSANYNAARILAVIDHVITITGTDRVDIMAHSQGGLITNALVHLPGSVGKIYRIVTFGTPWLGAPKLLGVLLYQEPCLASLALGGCGLDQGVAQQLIKNYPGAAELNPSRAYYAATVYSPLLEVVNSAPASLSFDQGYQVVKSVLAAAPLNRDTSLVDAADGFHDSVDNWAPLDPSVQLVRMIGYDGVESDNPCNSAPCSIAGSGRFAPGTGTITAIDIGTGDLYYGTGDGTVPLNSANLYDPATGFDYRNGAHDLYFCGISHQGLVQSDVVWQFAQPFLDGSTTYTHDDVKLGCPDSTDGTLQGVDLGNQSPPSPASVGQGSIFAAFGGGFAAGTTVTLTLHSSPRVIGSVTTDAQGHFSGTFGLPPTAPPGAHQLVADGVDPNGLLRELSVPLTVTPLTTGLGTTSSISGTAYDVSTAFRLAGICAEAFHAPNLAPAGGATSDSGGEFRISGLAPGAYKVEFTDCSGRGYNPIWYPSAANAAAAAVLSLAPGGERAQVDAAMAAARAASLTLAPRSAADPKGGTHTVIATAQDAAGNPASGVTVVFSVAGANSATGSSTTDTNGQATFSYTGVNEGQDTITAFADNNHNGVQDGGEPSSTATETWFTVLASGSFVIGDQNASTGALVTFWGSQWSNLNMLTGGPAPASFKGFASITSHNPPSCGANWTTRPGSSTQPPAGVPRFMAVIAASSITKSGTTIEGDSKKIVVIRTNNGYTADPGHPGTGTVVAVVC